MNRSNWKGFERKIAAFFGTRRTPLSGMNSGHNTSSDSLHDTLYIECKKRKSMAVVKLYDDTLKKARKEEKVPVVVVTETGRRGQPLIVCAMDDLQAIAHQRWKVRHD